MLIVRGVNVFPSAIREVVNEFQPDVSGMISVRPSRKGVQQLPPLRVLVELEEGMTSADRLAETIEGEIRKRLIVTTKVELVSFGTLPRSDYKSRLLDFANAEG
jgi:phenylacetate-CoA ligase